MKAKVVNVKRYKRGVVLDDGSPLMCLTCRIERKKALVADKPARRSRQAVVTAIKVSTTGSRLLVGYCQQHDQFEEE